MAQNTQVLTFTADDIIITEIARMRDGKLERVFSKRSVNVAGKPKVLGYVEEHLIGDERIAGRALGKVKKAAEAAFNHPPAELPPFMRPVQSKVEPKREHGGADRRAPGKDRPKSNFSPEDVFRPDASKSKSKDGHKGSPRQGNGAGKKSRQVEQLNPGDQVVGYVLMTSAEKGYSFFKVIGRVMDGELEKFEEDRQPRLFVHDRKVSPDLINDLDPESGRVYAIEVLAGRKPGEIEGDVFGLEDMIELKQAA